MSKNLVMGKIEKLKNHPYCNCKVITSPKGDNIIFRSYYTDVIQIRKMFGKRYVICTGTYSPTTSRQITYFLREYAPDLSLNDMKKIIGKKTFTIM